MNPAGPYMGRIVLALIVIAVYLLVRLVMWLIGQIP